MLLHQRRPAHRRSARFGTSTPELLVSVEAAWRGVPDIAVGNIVGSNIANILLIAGLTSLIWPISTD